MAVDRFDSSRLYAGGGRGVLVSSKAGLDWRPITAGLEATQDTGISRLAASLQTPNTVFGLAPGWVVSLGPPGANVKCVNGGFFVSRDGGEQWAPCGEGFPKLCTGTYPISGNISTFSIHPTDSRLIYAGGKNGLFRSTDEGNT